MVPQDNMEYYPVEIGIFVMAVRFPFARVHVNFNVSPDGPPVVESDDGATNVRPAIAALSSGLMDPQPAAVCSEQALFSE